MRKLYVIIIISLLVSCSAELTHEVTVSLNEEHYWEYHTGRPMWYTLKYFDGEKVRQKTLFAGTMKAEITVITGKSAVFAAYPLGTLHPAGGGFMSGDEENIRLHFTDGRLSELLLEAADMNPTLMGNLNPKRLFSETGMFFDSEALLVDLLNGEYKGEGKYRIKTYKVTLSDIPKGKYIPESESYPFFEIKDEELSVTVSLHPGQYRFMNTSMAIFLLVTVSADGSAEYRTYQGDIW